MVQLGQPVTVELPPHVTQRYNDQNPANPSVEVGTVRPAIVVGVNDEKQVANLRILHDGQGDFYAPGVPYDKITPVGEQPSALPPEEDSVGEVEQSPEEQATVADGGAADNSGDTGVASAGDAPGQVGPYNINREGTGEPYEGQGPHTTPLQGRVDATNTTTPVPVVQGVPPGQEAGPSSNTPEGHDAGGPDTWD